MNDVDRRLIESVCRNDLQSAKKIVKIILEQDKTQKNRMVQKADRKVQKKQTIRQKKKIWKSQKRIKRQ